MWLVTNCRSPHRNAKSMADAPTYAFKIANVKLFCVGKWRAFGKGFEVHMFWVKVKLQSLKDIFTTSASSPPPNLRNSPHTPRLATPCRGHPFHFRLSYCLSACPTPLRLNSSHCPLDFRTCFTSIALFIPHSRPFLCFIPIDEDHLCLIILSQYQLTSLVVQSLGLLLLLL